MAEGTTVNSDKKICPFYLRSSCLEGNICPYSHDIPQPDHVEIAKCRFWLRGMCKYEGNCWFSHSTSKTSVKSKLNDRQSAGPSSQCASSLSKQDVNKHNMHLLNKNVAIREKVPEFGPGSPNWVNAPEFIPKTNRSYADILRSNTRLAEPEPCSELEKILPAEMCGYYLFDGECPNNENCPCIHGDFCELCSKYCLSPTDETQRNLHIEYCEKELELDMELSFAVQRSKDKTCGICMEIIVEKDTISERRFGILEKCNHVYCLTCIRKWRQVKSFESHPQVEYLVDPGITRACPECRISSNFIIPSEFWVESEEEKKNLIDKYKIALSKKHCKYFKQGKETCPFGGACFYLHAKPDGTKVSLPLPTRRRRQNQDGELGFVDRIILWEYLESRDQGGLMHLDLDNLLYTLSSFSDDESDDSYGEENFLISESF